jgi:type I restriction enzyme M protein
VSGIPKARILEQLSATRLRELADVFELDGPRRAKDDILASFKRYRRIGTEAILNALSKDEVICLVEVLGLTPVTTKARGISALLSDAPPSESRRQAPPRQRQNHSASVTPSRQPSPSHEDVMTTKDTDNSEILSLSDGQIIDYISNKPIKDSPKEQVRQRVARALFHEDGIAVSDMESDFKARVDGKIKKIDIAIFEAGKEHTQEHLRRAVICQKEPKNGNKASYKLRTPEEAKREFELLKAVMADDASPNCEYGMWTNGLEVFYFRRKITKFDVKFRHIGQWPMADETIGTRDVASNARMRRADKEMLKFAFRRCHNFIHGNEGMSKDVAFWQFLYLIFCKMYDERIRNEDRRFWAGAQEEDQELHEWHAEIRKRIDSLFADVKAKYDSVFKGNEEIALSDRALAFMVNELSKYDLSRTDVDAKGVAYQEIVGDNLRGDRGQYFTPRCAIKLVVDILDPQPNERVLDPSCGTGGVLVETISHILEMEKRRTPTDGDGTTDFNTANDAVRQFVEANLFGCDFDPALVRATTMNLMMAAGSKGNVYHLDSLAFPKGHLEGVQAANKPITQKGIPLGSMDLVMTNPPFGADIPITDPGILGAYDLAAKWTKDKEDGSISRSAGMQTAVAPEVLFIQRAIDWLTPGGRVGIVLPDGILGNPGDEYIRKWILRRCWVLASVDLPVETFIVEANVNILTSLLFLKKKTKEEIAAEDLGQQVDYPVFMAVAEKVGFDRRGNTLYERTPEGEDRLEDQVEVESIRVGNRVEKRTLHRKVKIVDDDLPKIAKAYHAFRSENPEPGIPRKGSGQ